MSKSYILKKNSCSKGVVMKKTKEYRKSAREVLGSSIFGKKWLYALLALFVEGALVSIISATGVGTIVALIIIGPLNYGLISIFMRLSRKQDEKAELSHLFDGFKERFGESAITAILSYIFTFLWTLLLIIPGIIKSYSYAAALYVVHETKLEGTEAITESRRLMNGKKWKLFCLDFSFIGWYLLGMLCLGIGVLWVEPYHTAARTEFMLDVLKEGGCHCEHCKTETEVIDVK